MAKKDKLPKTLYVRWDYPDNGEPWLTNGETPESMLEFPCDNRSVGVYKLEKIVTVKSTVNIEVGK
jgi:hypothetical protein